MFNHGKIEQIDSPQVLYDKPQTEFVARFVGASNVINETLAEQLTGKRAAFSIRSEKLMVSPSDENGLLRFNARVNEVLYHGANARIEIGIEGAEKLAAVCAWDAASNYTPGDPIEVGFRYKDAVFFKS